MIEFSLKSIQDLASDSMNILIPFSPSIWTEQRAQTRRHTPMVFANSPWDPGDALWVEVPEYAWASIPGDEHNNSPFFYGREFGLKKMFTLRYRSLEMPQWKKRPGGGVELDNPLEGGYVVRFKVIPHDRMIEVRFGITNDSQKPLNKLRCQLCMMSHEIKSLAERWPTSSRMLAGGEVISWDGAGQDLSWLDGYHDKQTGQFSQSCFFLASLEGYRVREYIEPHLPHGDLMWLDRTLDVPAIAKEDTTGTNRYLVVYSPFGRNTFYNVLCPCFHADPYMNQVEPGETRWTISYFVLFEGDIERFLVALKDLHQRLKREDGILE
jgi:hypothetical protein